MSVPLYMDEHVPSSITEGLRLRGLDALTVQEDGREGDPDESVVERATSLGRVVFTRDEDYLKIAAAFQATSTRFSGIIYAHQLRVSIRQCIADLEFLSTAGELSDFSNEVFHLPYLRLP